MPFTDFTPLANGTGEFDFVHLKDWTFVDPKPLDQPFVFSNMILLGGPPGCNGSPVAPPVAPPVTPGTEFQSSTQESVTQSSATEGKSTQTNTSTQNPSLNDANRFTATVLNFWLVLLGFLA